MLFWKDFCGGFHSGLCCTGQGDTQPAGEMAKQFKCKLESYRAPFQVLLGSGLVLLNLVLVVPFSVELGPHSVTHHRVPRIMQLMIHKHILHVQSNHLTHDPIVAHKEKVHPNKQSFTQIGSVVFWYHDETWKKRT